MAAAAPPAEPLHIYFRFEFAFFSNWYGWAALRSGSVIRTLPEGECGAAVSYTPLPLPTKGIV